MSTENNNNVHYTDGREPEEEAASRRSRSGSDASDGRCPSSPRRNNANGSGSGSPGRRSPPTRRGKGRGRRGGGGSSNNNNSPTSSPLLLTTPPRTRKSRNPTSPPHDAPMGKKDIYFALDCEMVGVTNENGGLDDALARVTIVNYDEEIVLDRFVKVPVPVSDYRTFVSGVSKEDIESSEAISWEECNKIVKSVLHGKILIGHGLQSDLKALGISHPWTDIRDTARYAPYMKEGGNNSNQRVLLPRKLRDLVYDVFGVRIQTIGKAHSPIEDAVAALSLYKAARGEWEQAVMRQVHTARQLEQQQQQQSAAVAAAAAALQQQQQQGRTRRPMHPQHRRRVYMQQQQQPMMQPSRVEGKRRYPDACLLPPVFRPIPQQQHVEQRLSGSAPLMSMPLPNSPNFRPMPMPSNNARAAGWNSPQNYYHPQGMCAQV